MFISNNMNMHCTWRAAVITPTMDDEMKNCGQPCTCKFGTISLQNYRKSRFRNAMNSDNSRNLP